MKKNFKKALWAIVMMATLTAALTITLGMFNNKSQTKAQVESTATIQEKIPKAKSTAVKYIYYFREYNGWTQKRLWNRTAGKWAEPYWHNVEKIKK